MLYDRQLLQKGAEHGTLPGIDKNVHTDNVIQGEDLCRVCRRFMGAGMSQSYVGIYWFEYYQETNMFEYVVELGSQKGALSTYYANMAAITERFFFETYEWDKERDWFNRPTEGVGHWYERLAKMSPYINTYAQDVFSEETFSHIEENSREFKTFIFCDGGDKVREFNMYAPLLKVGDRIAVHDWEHEIFPHQIQATCDKYNLIPDEPFAESSTKFQTLIMPFRRSDG